MENVLETMIFKMIIDAKFLVGGATCIFYSNWWQCFKLCLVYQNALRIATS